MDRDLTTFSAITVPSLATTRANIARLSQTAAAGRTTSSTTGQQTLAHARTAAEEQWKRLTRHLVFDAQNHHPQ